jgi:Family of unknown function (DUF6455)
MGRMMVGASQDRSRLVDLLGGIRHWAANENARLNVPPEIDTLDRTGPLGDVPRDFNMTRSDVGAMLNADPETPRRLEELLEWLDLADLLRGGSRRWFRDIQVACQRCQATGNCDHWLAGDRKRAIGEFCPNTKILKALYTARH